jgi:hypothetical protein
VKTISDRPFIVDVWHVWSNGDLRKQRFRYSSREDAERAARSQFELSDTTRIRLSRENPYGGKAEVLKIWEK